MPIYEYACRACGHELEALQKYSEQPLVDCPACKEPQLQKRISAAGFRLSGSGWYETDFKSDKRRNLSGDQSESKAENKAEKPPKDQKTEKKKDIAAKDKPSTKQARQAS